MCELYIPATRSIDGKGSIRPVLFQDLLPFSAVSLSLSPHTIACLVPSLSPLLSLGLSRPFSSFPFPSLPRCPIRGQGQGTKYIEPHKPFLYELFMAGEAEKKHRKNPAQMPEALQLLHPEALNLPEHGEISSFIGSLVSRAKKGKTGTPGTRAPPVPT